MSISIDSGAIRLNSLFLTRTIELEDGPFSCDVFLHPPETGTAKPLHLDTGWGIPFEAAVRIGGRWHFCGIRRQRCALWRELAGEFTVQGATVREGRLGECAVLKTRSESLNLELEIEYELSERVPVMRKSVRVRNVGTQPVTVANVAVELIYASRAGHLLHFLHDYRQEVEGVGRFFAGYCDFRFPGDIDVELGAGEVFESFNLYELFLPEAAVAQSVWRGRVLRELVPWALEGRETTFQVSGLKPEAGETWRELFLPLFDRCAGAGFEKIMFFWDQLFTNTGDYLPRPELFPRGAEELPELVREIRKRGMKAGVYASYSIALPESRIRLEHLDWECCDENGLTFDPGAFGNMCFLSGWGEYIRGIFETLCDWGFEEIQIDGPTDIPCVRPGHRHAGPGNYQFRNWLWEKELFAFLQRRGVVFTIPRGVSYLLMGASAVPGGYKEEDFCHSADRELLENYRGSIHAARRLLPAWCSWGFLAVGSYHGHRIELSEEDPELFEQGLASLFGCGHNRVVSGDRAAAGPRTLEVLRRWISWFKRWRYLFNGDCVKLGVPGEDPVDGLLFTDPERREALAVLVNPGGAACRKNFLFPLKFAGLSGRVAVTEYREETHFVRELCSDDSGQLFTGVEVPSGAVLLLHFAAGGGDRI